MRYFFHIMTGSGRAVDPEGAEFADLAAARTEAVLCAREAMAERLRSGEAIPADWLVEIAGSDGRVIETLAGESIVLGAALRDRHRRVYNAIHHPYLLLTPDLGILEANPAYLNATFTDLAAIRHRDLFDVFPDNPGDPEADGVRNLSRSLKRVLQDKRPHFMADQRYDIRRRDGSWELRVWRPVNLPVLDQHGEVDFIVHHVQDVTGEAAGAPAPERSEALQLGVEERD